MKDIAVRPWHNVQAATSSRPKEHPTTASFRHVKDGEMFLLHTDKPVSVVHDKDSNHLEQKRITNLQNTQTEIKANKNNIFVIGLKNTRSDHRLSLRFTGGRSAKEFRAQ